MVSWQSIYFFLNYYSNFILPSGCMFCKLFNLVVASPDKLLNKTAQLWSPSHQHSKWHQAVSLSVLKRMRSVIP